MHRNPVKRGMVESPEQWRGALSLWSSYRFYLLDEPGPGAESERRDGERFRFE